jgi:DivIVA domain-containing protein
MIDLTPLEVRQKKGDFRRAMRGYEPALVDDFLDLVAERLEAVVRENRAMHDDLARLREQLTEFKERERALTEALVTAQEMREELRKQAERDAELVRREAEAEIARQRAESAAEFEREQDSLRTLRARRAQLLRSFRTFLERELAELSVAEDAVAAESGEGAAPAQGRKKARPRQEPPMLPFETVAEDVREAEPGDEPLALDWLSSVLKEEEP